MTIKNINITFSKRCGYTVEVNGEILLECLSADELNNLTVNEILELYAEFC